MWSMTKKNPILCLPMAFRRKNKASKYQVLVLIFNTKINSAQERVSLIQSKPVFTTSWRNGT